MATKKLTPAQEILRAGLEQPMTDQEKKRLAAYVAKMPNKKVNAPLTASVIYSRLTKYKAKPLWARNHDGHWRELRDVTVQGFRDRLKLSKDDGSTVWILRKDNDETLFRPIIDVIADDDRKKTGIILGDMTSAEKMDEDSIKFNYN